MKNQTSVSKTTKLTTAARRRATLPAKAAKPVRLDSIKNITAAIRQGGFKGEITKAVIEDMIGTGYYSWKAQKQEGESDSQYKARRRKSFASYMGKLRKQTKESNANIVRNLAEMGGEKQHIVMREIINTALPTLLPEYQAVAMFRSMKCIMDAKGDDRREALGFKDGKLVICDGKKFRPASLVQSVRWYRSSDQWWGEVDYDSEAHDKWLGMIAKALAA